MQEKYWVCVTDKHTADNAGSYLYGPFPTLMDARCWVGVHHYDFASRLVNIIHPEHIIEPEIEAA